MLRVRTSLPTKKKSKYKKSLETKNLLQCSNNNSISLAWIALVHHNSSILSDWILRCVLCCSGCCLLCMLCFLHELFPLICHFALISLLFDLFLQVKINLNHVHMTFKRYGSAIQQWLRVLTLVVNHKGITWLNMRVRTPNRSCFADPQPLNFFLSTYPFHSGRRYSQTCSHIRTIQVCFYSRRFLYNRPCLQYIH